ncbi:MAG: hypothetical protein ICV68_05645 [Pyrinomonadaceae bacterium]|nr:hypothetical protein [Pyrinomonadaceae bacterium]
MRHSIPLPITGLLVRGGYFRPARRLFQSAPLVNAGTAYLNLSLKLVANASSAQLVAGLEDSLQKNFQARRTGDAQALTTVDNPPALAYLPGAH